MVPKILRSDRERSSGAALNGHRPTSSVCVVNMNRFRASIREERCNRCIEICSIDDGRVNHHLVVVERANRKLSSGELDRKLTTKVCRAALNAMLEDRAGRSILGVASERVMRNQNEFLTNIGIEQALATGVARVLVRQVNRSPGLAPCCGIIDGNGAECVGWLGHLLIIGRCTPCDRRKSDRPVHRWTG